MGLDRSDTLAVTAIVISLIALVSTIGQILQQYLGTSDGYRRCRSSVMGLWGKSTRRIFDWGDMRFEVFFETPDIFVGSPENIKGPVKQRLVYHLTGTDESYSNSRTEIMATGADARTDGEPASWIKLISVIQNQERISRQWDRDFGMCVIPRRPMVSPIYYSRCVQLQRRTQSWSFVPSGVVKPYAFSRMTDIIQIVAMLGMQWTAFDQSVGNLVAEGNGLVLTSALVPGLGLLISFAETGKSRFEETRVIPSIHLPDLCFGFVASILEETPINLRRNIRLGSRDEVAATLYYFGCDFDTIRRYEKRHTHLFSVAFEIIGMLGACFRLRNSAFRRLPNPTTDQWPEKISALDLMKFFGYGIEQNYEHFSKMEGGSEAELEHVKNMTLKLSDTLTNTNIERLSISHREMIHDTLEVCTEHIRTFPEDIIKEIVTAHLQVVMEVLDDPANPLGYNRRDTTTDTKEQQWMSFYFRVIRPRVISKTVEKNEWNTLWVTLMLRMLCWFLLHDFDPRDVKIVPSNLRGSRIPVYIG